MDSRNKIRIVAGLAAVALACAIIALTGSAVNAADHWLHHAFDALSPDGRARAIAIGRFLPYWLPGTTIALIVALADWRHRRAKRAEEAQADAPARFGRLG